MNISRIKTLAMALTLGALVTSPATGQESNSFRLSKKSKPMEIKVAHARIIFLSATATDPGPDLNPATAGDNDTVGPEFVVKGDIVSVDGAPATGAFVCRGSIFTAQGPGPHGIAQVNVSWDIDGRGLLMGQSVEFRTGQPAGAVLGGTGEFQRAAGTYVPSGVPAPLGDGNFTFTFMIRQD
ncbi:MAG TPA: hypothetical protein VKF81_14960 [Blastocatellia bacterium]|nr:hypothetical protein [Blastocatellia bacterium]